MSKIDIWSTRIANFSQVGVLALAVFGYFYTVLPVYQKSLLDEEIAKKTLELENKDKKIAEINKQLEERASVLKSLSDEVSAAKKDAATAKTNLRSMQGKYSKQYSELRIHLLSQFISLAYSQCHKLNWDNQTIAKCFNKVANSGEMSELNNADIIKLKRSIANETPTLITNYNIKKDALDRAVRDINNKIKEAENECNNNRRKPEYKDEIQKISIDHDCAIKKMNAGNGEIKLQLEFIFAKEKIMSDSLSTIATKAAN